LLPSEEKQIKLGFLQKAMLLRNSGINELNSTVFYMLDFEMKTIRCPEYPVTSQARSRNKPEELISQVHRGDILKCQHIASWCVKVKECRERKHQCWKDVLGSGRSQF
jgi:hypothetical protein